MIDSEIEYKIREEQKKFLGYVLSIAELSLDPDQFRRFKKLSFDAFHDRLTPSVRAILEQSPTRKKSP